MLIKNLINMSEMFAHRVACESLILALNVTKQPHLHIINCIIILGDSFYKSDFKYPYM